MNTFQLSTPRSGYFLKLPIDREAPPASHAPMKKGEYGIRWYFPTGMICVKKAFLPVVYRNSRLRGIFSPRIKGGVWLTIQCAVQWDQPFRGTRDRSSIRVPPRMG